MNRYIRLLRNASLALYLASPLLLADDTDIYYSAFDGASRPLVMLALDVRSNLTATQCADIYEDSCRADLTDDLYFNLDIITARDPDDPSIVTFGPDGEPDATPFRTDASDFYSVDVDALHLAWAAAEGQSGSYLDGKVNLMDVLRAAFQYILNDEKVQKSGMWLGLMVSHEADANCAGILDIPSGNGRGCSGGAYILKDFFDITVDTELDDFYSRLAALPTPTHTPLANNGNWNGHTYQLAELYFEFYRYITGQAMHNGWLGYNDYNSGDSRETLTDYLANDAPYDTELDQYVASVSGATYWSSSVS